MSLIFQRHVEGPKTHALVIGVGNYPHAKPGQGAHPFLRQVADLPSAADSAKLICDWLLVNRNRLVAPLATLEVLISDPAASNDRYPWQSGPVEPATEELVALRGWEWYQRVLAEDGNVAFFYCCGHGASHREWPVVFLEDLNRHPINPWSHINLHQLASALRKCPSISAAFLFSDACGEYLPEFELGKAQETRFYNEQNMFVPSGNRVSLMCAAAEGQLAYEGEDAPGSGRMFGRFTLACLKGLDGSSARLTRDRFAVSCYYLLGDLKPLRRVFFSHWSKAEPFEPYQVVMQTDPLPIVYPQGFELPVEVMTNPLDRMADYSLVISERSDPHPPWLRNRDAGDPGAWYTTVPPDTRALWAIAVGGGNNYASTILPRGPIFDEWVRVP
jgi:hypothetical protein